MSHLQNLLRELSDLSLAVEYWDVRVEDTFETNIQVVDGEIVTCAVSPSLGAFVRVRNNGFWFYESTTELSRLKSILENLSRSPQQGRGQLAFVAEKHPPYIAMTATDRKFSAIPLERKLDVLKKYDAVLAGASVGASTVASRTIRYKDVYKIKSYLNSVGTQFEFDFNQGGVICGFTLKERDVLFNDFMRVYGSSFEALEQHENRLAQCVAEAGRFLKAPAIEPGKYKVVLDPEVAGVFTHESFGHKSEADFMLGNQEAMDEWKLGKKIGADCLTIVDHGLRPGTSGYCPIDDDGTPAQKNYLIKNGVLSGRLHSRATAIELGERPTGNSRAMNFEFEPIVRMTSTYIEPGTESI
ncbi:MAG: TldD/PmbA family protein, partial [Bdellovibrionaceae bacterium]|nr:TldD/PmbA family protein [Pseudobdellovibrionaceae bacterium]